MNTAPVKVFSSRGIEAAIWLKNNETAANGTPSFEIDISRTYRDQTGYHHTNRFATDDLGRVLLVTEAALRFLALREYSPGKRRGGVQSSVTVGANDDAGQDAGQRR